MIGIGRPNSSSNSTLSAVSRSAASQRSRWPGAKSSGHNTWAGMRPLAYSTVEVPNAETTSSRLSRSGSPARARSPFAPPLPDADGSWSSPAGSTSASVLGADGSSRFASRTAASTTW